ncbi:MAG TPA: 30S ribosomal protein S16 [Candidatus Paceibacterota bacterium]
MLMIRLQRVGRKNDPSYRVVVTEKTNGPQSGKYLEMLGSYDARKDSQTFDGDRIKHWISKGAQLSPTVHNLLVDADIVEGKKINVLPKNKNKKAVVPEVSVEEAPKEEKEEKAEAEVAPVEAQS